MALCPRSETMPHKRELELTTVFYSIEQQRNHCYCRKCGRRVLLLTDGRFARHQERER